jgi:hypothetical protein
VTFGTLTRALSCVLAQVFDPICVGVFDLIMGPTTHLNTTRLPFCTIGFAFLCPSLVYSQCIRGADRCYLYSDLNYFPAATSVKNLAHW